MLAPTGRDGRLVEETLVKAGIACELCATIEDLCRKAEQGAGALFIAEEALTVEGIAELSRFVEQQPPWSDTPIIVSTSKGATTEARVRRLSSVGETGNVVILERPVRIFTMVVTVQSALRARRRQYQMRNLSKQIEHERAKLEALIMQAPVAICIMEGPDLRFTVANPSYSQLAQGRAMIGKPVSEVFPDLQGSETLQMMLDVYASGEPCDLPEYSLSFRRDDGTVHDGYYRSAYRALRDRSDRIIGVVAVTLELTEQVKARRTAETANRAKDEFLAMLGHELRNPLAPILTALELMRMREEQSVAKERAVIERQARHMATLVDDLLDVSRITRGKIVLKREVCELAELISKAVETTAPLLEQRRHQMVTDVPARKYFVHADPARMTQVFSNILANAAKYTDDGGRISIAAGREGDDVVVRISDTGRGISAEMLPEIFNLFSQAQQNLDRSQGGLGLGLAIVSSLVEMHGGRVTAESEGVGRGSQFVVRLPAVSNPAIVAAARPTARQEQPNERAASTSARAGAPSPAILVVDDNQDAAGLLAEILRLMGYFVRVAHDGAEALAIARENDPPVAALLDIGLPVMDGYELARRLRKLPGWQHVCLLAVTGYGQEADKQMSRQAGFNLHLVKPIDHSLLKRALEDIPSLSVSNIE